MRTRICILYLVWAEDALRLDFVPMSLFALQVVHDDLAQVTSRLYRKKRARIAEDDTEKLLQDAESDISNEVGLGNVMGFGNPRGSWVWVPVGWVGVSAC